MCKNAHLQQQRICEQGFSYQILDAVGNKTTIVQRNSVNMMETKQPQQWSFNFKKTSKLTETRAMISVGEHEVVAGYNSRKLMMVTE